MVLLTVASHGEDEWCLAYYNKNTGFDLGFDFERGPSMQTKIKINSVHSWCCRFLGLKHPWSNRAVVTVKRKIKGNQGLQEGDWTLTRIIHCYKNTTLLPVWYFLTLCATWKQIPSCVFGKEFTTKQNPCFVLALNVNMGCYKLLERITSLLSACLQCLCKFN